MVARATAPNRVGPESVFPDAGTWDFSDGLKGSPMASAPFWLALVCQIVIVFGYFWFYRKEQLCTSSIHALCEIVILTSSFQRDHDCGSNLDTLFSRSLLRMGKTSDVVSLPSGLNCNSVALTFQPSLRLLDTFIIYE
jgi:hypothetical protein